MYKLNIPEEVIQKSYERLEKVYRFETPDRLPFFFTIDENRVPVWEDKFADGGLNARLYINWKDNPTDEDFDGEISGIVKSFNDTYARFPEFDYCPIIMMKSIQELVLTAMGLPYNIDSTGELHLNWLENILITDPKEFLKTRPMPDTANGGLMRQFTDRVKYYVTAAGGKIPVQYIDYQSPYGLAAKAMDATELMMMAMDDPALVRELLDYFADVIISVVDSMDNAVKEAKRAAGISPLDSLKTTAGADCVSAFGLPRGVRGMLWDDYLSFMSPDLYLNTVGPSNEKIFKHFNGGMIHTCGPMWGELPESILGLEGCTGLNYCWIRPEKTRTTADMLELKKRFAGKITYNCELPVDPENITPDFIKRLTDGGGVFLWTFTQSKVGEMMRGVLEGN